MQGLLTPHVIIVQIVKAIPAQTCAVCTATYLLLYSNFSPALEMAAAHLTH
jgi:hypothetical protein